MAQEVVTLAGVGDPGPITSDEPLAAEFSPANAARYLDTASLHWQKSRKCATCHTNMSYLFARPALQAALADSGEVRTFFEEQTKTWDQRRPNPTTAGVVAAALTFNVLPSATV